MLRQLMKKNKKVSPITDYDNTELQALLDVGKALSSEHETEKVLDMILSEAINNTQSDGGSIYLIEKIPQDSFGGRRPRFCHKLKFHKSVNRSLNKLINSDVLLDIDSSSIAGHVAYTGESLLIEDCYNLPVEATFTFNKDFDEKNQYRTKSVLAVPIKTNKSKVVGVVQLVNKMKVFRRETDPASAKKGNKQLNVGNIISYSAHDVRLMEAFASHAAVALENAKLTQDIEKLFASFVRASVTAIESRDPSTSGHSDRVADLTCSLAEKVDHVDSGIYKDISFSAQQMKEIRYAALLHDFGKIGVKENVLLKAKKLYPHELETILLRLDTVKSKNESIIWRDIAEKATDLVEELKANDGKPHVCDHSGCNHASHKDAKNQLAQALWNIDGFNRKVDQIREAIVQANESQVMQGDLNIQELVKFIETVSKNLNQTILLPAEKNRLLIPRGTLSPEERKEIESHVSHTFTFLYQIAWTDDLAGVPEIAHAHHEKLDGTGYPRKLKADQIPIQSRMMAICDIYDALTAMDRAYKKSVSNERALEILNLEVKEGKLDKSLVDMFIEAQVYRIVQGYKKVG